MSVAFAAVDRYRAAQRRGVVIPCHKTGWETGIDPISLIEMADDAVRPIRPEQGVIDGDGLLLRIRRRIRSFLLHARRAAERYGVPTRDILLELGERKVVGGQEDMIIDVAMDLQRRAAA